MLKEERHRRILDAVGRNGKVMAASLCRQLHVSEDTIRRDLQELDAEGKLLRVHGGALTRTRSAPSYQERREHRPQAKAAIGRAAASLVRAGQTIFMDGGTTTLQVARALPSDLRLTIITNSLPLALELVERPECSVVLLGGHLLKESQVVVGAGTVEQIQRFHADLLFLGTCAIHPSVGVSVPNLEECAVKRAMMEAATATVGLAIEEKLNSIEPFVVAPVRELSRLITEASASEDLLEPYRRIGLSILSV